jgi:fluoroacetyl-CoA thioesterase
MTADSPKVFEKTYTVTDQDAIHFMGADALPVLATPTLIKWMEFTCRENAAPLLGPGHDTVGVSVNIKHLAATPVGAVVRVVSKLTRTEGRVYSFEVEAFDPVDKIGEGTHQRASVNVAKFAERVKAKKEKIGGDFPRAIC